MFILLEGKTSIYLGLSVQWLHFFPHQSQVIAYVHVVHTLVIGKGQPK